MRPMLVAYAYGLLRDHARAEDAVHEAYLVVMDKYGEFEEGTSLVAWCRTIVRYKAAETLRRERRLVTVEERILNEAVENAFQLTQRETHAARHATLLEALDYCLARLAKEPKALLSACYREGLTYEELASRFNLQVEAVRKRLYRIRGALRDCTRKHTAAAETSS